ncbi:glyoxylase-like metal-dependent hydrolase (beta-lactamase superfamily II) [Pontibacter aydingkolensis]|uniref:MBL fold metallo-hydrolase n=1 Tax=Pontibacter aydingkolensis TaxID=1911536 RepID=A0ABS7CUH6_9BACT|nr:MBL fold metallo-hydrolase [Pontibacter aydingkolensis]MBW7467498.1 MBL fold metallo-hydrolase [Pontibacter aydingkolensis]
METSKRLHTPASRQTFAVAPRVWGLKTLFANLYFVANPNGSWVLVDTGVKGYAHQIRSAADELFGENSVPQAIVLTHGHFDHIGTVRELAEHWQVPVYAHPMEFPYLTGQSSYPPPDPSVGGGAMAYLSFIYPKKPIDIHQLLVLLPEEGIVPALEGWHWVFTPGHSPGHVSFFREEDRVLLAGDAFTTRDAESAIAVMTEKREVHGPPNYYTPDWGNAHRSVETLLNLNPKIAATGHGMPMKGEELTRQLENLVKNFWLKAVPKHGRYVHEPAITDEQGVVSLPPEVSNTVPKVLAVAGAVAVAGLFWMAIKKRNNSKQKNGQGHYGSYPKNRPYSHNRVMTGLPPTIDPDFDDPDAHTNNYP